MVSTRKSYPHRSEGLWVSPDIPFKLLMTFPNSARELFVESDGVAEVSHIQVRQ